MCFGGGHGYIADMLTSARKWCRINLDALKIGDINWTFLFTGRHFWTENAVWYSGGSRFCQMRKHRQIVTWNTGYEWTVTKNCSAPAVSQKKMEALMGKTNMSGSMRICLQKYLEWNCQPGDRLYHRKEKSLVWALYGVSRIQRKRRWICCNERKKISREESREEVLLWQSDLYCEVKKESRGTTNQRISYVIFDRFEAILLYGFAGGVESRCDNGETVRSL